MGRRFEVVLEGGHIQSVLGTSKVFENPSTADNDVLGVLVCSVCFTVPGNTHRNAFSSQNVSASRTS